MSAARVTPAAVAPKRNVDGSHHPLPPPHTICNECGESHSGHDGAEAERPRVIPHADVELTRRNCKSEECAIDADWLDARAVALHLPARPPRHAADDERPSRRTDVHAVVRGGRLPQLGD